MDNDVEADKKDEQVASLSNDEAHKKKKVKRDKCTKKRRMKERDAIKVIYIIEIIFMCVVCCL